MKKGTGKATSALLTGVAAAAAVVSLQNANEQTVHASNGDKVDNNGQQAVATAAETPKYDETLATKKPANETEYKQNVNTAEKVVSQASTANSEAKDALDKAQTAASSQAGVVHQAEQNVTDQQGAIDATHQDIIDKQNALNSASHAATELQAQSNAASSALSAAQSAASDAADTKTDVHKDFIIASSAASNAADAYDKQATITDRASQAVIDAQIAKNQAAEDLAAKQKEQVRVDRLVEDTASSLAATKNTLSMAQRELDAAITERDQARIELDEISKTKHKVTDRTPAGGEADLSLPVEELNLGSLKQEAFDADAIERAFAEYLNEFRAKTGTALGSGNPATRTEEADRIARIISESTYIPTAQREFFVVEGQIPADVLSNKEAAYALLVDWLGDDWTSTYITSQRGKLLTNTYKYYGFYVSPSGKATFYVAESSNQWNSGLSKENYLSAITNQPFGTYKPAQVRFRYTQTVVPNPTDVKLAEDQLSRKQRAVTSAQGTVNETGFLKNDLETRLNTLTNVTKVNADKAVDDATQTLAKAAIHVTHMKDELVTEEGKLTSAKNLSKVANQKFAEAKAKYDTAVDDQKKADDAVVRASKNVYEIQKLIAKNNATIDDTKVAIQQLKLSEIELTKNLTSLLNQVKVEKAKQAELEKPIAQLKLNLAMTRGELAKAQDYLKRVIANKPDGYVEPETPVDPEKPVNPETPVDPEKPVNPEKPVDPEGKPGTKPSDDKKSGDVSLNKVAAKKTTTTPEELTKAAAKTNLPQTGEESTTGATLAGAAMALMGMTGLAASRKRKED